MITAEFSKNNDEFGCYSYDELKAQGWPVDFDFETDETCQKEFLPFIEEQLKILDGYDHLRDLNSDYYFYEHALNAADDVKNTCMALGLGWRVSNNMYYATLIHDAGKPELPPETWDAEGSPTSERKAAMRAHVHLGADLFENNFPVVDHAFKKLALDIIANHHERMDGKGENKIAGADLSMPARLVCIVEDYDGRTHLRPQHVLEGRKNDPASVLDAMERKMVGAFDDDLYQAFKGVKLRQLDLAPTPDSPEASPL